MPKKTKKTLIPKPLIISCIITGLATVILRMLNRKLQIQEIAEINGYIGTVFAISLIIIIGIWVVNVVNKR